MRKLSKTETEKLNRYTPDLFHHEYDAMPEDEAIEHKIASVEIREREEKRNAKICQKELKKNMKRLQKVLKDRQNATTNGKS
jgi:glycerol-3-phosphate cytidylyltransferase-like family protein